jgi:hypothetical protein
MTLRRSIQRNNRMVSAVVLAQWLISVTDRRVARERRARKRNRFTVPPLAGNVRFQIILDMV